MANLELTLVNEKCLQFFYQTNGLTSCSWQQWQKSVLLTAMTQPVKDFMDGFLPCSLPLVRINLPRQFPSYILSRNYNSTKSLCFWRYRCCLIHITCPKDAYCHHMAILWSGSLPSVKFYWGPLGQPGPPRQSNCCPSYIAPSIRLKQLREIWEPQSPSKQFGWPLIKVTSGLSNSPLFLPC